MAGQCRAGLLESVGDEQSWSAKFIKKPLCCVANAKRSAHSAVWQSESFAAEDLTYCASLRDHNDHDRPVREHDLVFRDSFVPLPRSPLPSIPSSSHPIVLTLHPCLPFFLRPSAPTCFPSFPIQFIPFPYLPFLIQLPRLFCFPATTAHSIPKIA
ncbi:hypothetical protein MPTK1_3g23610 [Marchantia polymorpha subsp. ruderalis]|uniref:Uncharacterized protein n=2 Tax=Marchantia polymorpha TaxID=3197 RepID=A0AAF6B416_MARPO|nr:hypothetical protein MARPO_0024s0137 [Marchantia polymorpha]BBN06750.1 hypothetical protein Mp_3g23610 [Marchantia polymorpha subsp. ruderalis]|eukprot:PTQ43649.1 hypothetical protein MARPO_0024s0137 [Marchantia polymorpha]